jgi:hypothetical protein
MDTQKIPGKKPGIRRARRLSRSEIVEGLQRTPVSNLLVGAQSKTKSLTRKQQAFAERIALGDTKAAAYRAAYDTQAKPEIQSHEGMKLARHPTIAIQIEALRLAAEARNHATPAALRSLVIQKLTELAINPSEKAAQRLRALELLGKVTEIAAFTERREIVHSESVSESRSKLIANLRLALANNLPSHLIDAAERNIVTDCDTQQADGERVTVESEPSDALAQDFESPECGQSDPTPPHPPDEIFGLARTLA